jgi:hypothetical protein
MGPPAAGIRSQALSGPPLVLKSTVRESHTMTDDEYTVRTVAPEDALRALPPEMDDNASLGAGTLELPGPPTDVVRFRIEPAGEPQAGGTQYFAVEEATNRRFYVGKVALYHSRRGIARYGGEEAYDRAREEGRIGLWAHFIWPSVMAEGAGKHLVINSWDRAHFTWGFYQLAAHTAGDNLILLMRELLQLPTAKFYFPDLTLVDGKVAKRTPAGPVTLERPLWSEQHRETQIPDFMLYLNPTSTRVENAEVVSAAKFIDWAQRDPDMLGATVRVSLAIMKRKLTKYADTFGLIGRRPELAIWISDMFHQGRASKEEALAALDLPTLGQQLDALSRIDTTGQHAPRLATVKRHVQTLLNERLFDSVRFGEGPLSLAGA